LNERVLPQPTKRPDDFASNNELRNISAMGKNNWPGRNNPPAMSGMSSRQQALLGGTKPKIPQSNEN
jgi:hypothetical protein